MTQLTVGDTAPQFTLPDGTGRAVALESLVASTRTGLVVYFYPKAGTHACTKQACDFRDSLAAWSQAGYTVVGISPDSSAVQARFSQRHDIPFRLLSDPDHSVMEAWGAWGQKKSCGRTYTGAVRSTVVVGADGRVVLARYNVKATGHVRRLQAELGLDHVQAVTTEPQGAPGLP